MAESAGKPQASKSKTEKAKVEKNRAEKTDTSRAASAKSGSSRENAGVKADDTVKANSGAKISAGAKAQAGAKANAAVRPEAVPVDFAADPTNYVNRELSWLEFNYRVLSESRDKSIPLFERLKSGRVLYGQGGLLKGHGTCKVHQARYCRSDAPGTAGPNQREDP